MDDDANQSNVGKTVLKSQQVPSLSTTAKMFVVIFLLSSVLLPPYTVTILSLLYVIYYLLSMRFTIPKVLFNYLTIPMLLIIIGILGSSGNPLYDALKDGWYFFNPSIVLSAGYLFMHRNRNLYSALNLVVSIGIMISICQIFIVLYGRNITFAYGQNIYRSITGKGMFVSLLAFIIIMYIRKIDHSSMKRYNTAAILIVIGLISSMAFSFSRSLLFSLLIAVIAMKGWFSRKALVGFYSIALIIIGVIVLNYYATQHAGSEHPLIVKITKSIDELILADYYSPAEINRHWRGYESYMAFKQYTSGNLANIIFGHGFGTLVDLKLYMELKGETVRFIPVLHNGYMYLLVKTGIVGLLLFLMYLFLIIKTGILTEKSSNETFTIFIGRFIIALGLIVLFTTFVISGIFNKNVLVTHVYFLGSLLSFVHSKKRFRVNVTDHNILPSDSRI